MSSNTNLIATFLMQAELFPNNVALWVNNKAYTYHELANNSERVASWLLDSVGSKARIGILSSRNINTYTGILGTLWSGNTYVPLNPKLPGSYLKKIMDSADLGGIIVDSHSTPVLEKIFSNTFSCPVLLPETKNNFEHSYIQTLDSTNQPSQIASVPSDTTAYIMFTSGTTGTPKGVMVSHANVLHHIQVMQNMFNVTQDDRLSQTFETSFDVSVFDMFMAWHHGAACYVLPETQLMSPLNFIRNHNLTFWFNVPSSIAQLVRMNMLPPESLPSLRYSLFVGEPLPINSAIAWQKAAPNSKVMNMYGPTETTITCLHQALTDTPEVTPQRGVMAIGKPHSGTKAGIINDKREFVPNGIAGELVISGPQVTQGYWKSELITNQKYCEVNHPDFGTGQCYLTGDLAYVDAQGVFHHLGRIDNQVKVRGYRVELEEIEFSLRQVCQTESTAVVPWPVENGSASGLVAFIDKKIEINPVLATLRTLLPSYMVPNKIIILDELPLTPNKKIDKNFLSENMQNYIEDS